MTEEFYKEANTRVQVNSNSHENSAMKAGLGQGNVMLLWLFNAYMDDCTKGSESGSGGC